MRRIISVATLAAAMSVAAVSTAAAPDRSQLCFMRCQYECMAIYPGGSPEWQQCYVACAAERCYVH